MRTVCRAQRQFVDTRLQRGDEAARFATDGLAIHDGSESAASIQDHHLTIADFEGTVISGNLKRPLVDDLQLLSIHMTGNFVSMIHSPAKIERKITAPKSDRLGMNRRFWMQWPNRDHQPGQIVHGRRRLARLILWFSTHLRKIEANLTLHATSERYLVTLFSLLTCPNRESSQSCPNFLRKGKNNQPQLHRAHPRQRDASGEKWAGENVLIRRDQLLTIFFD